MRKSSRFWRGVKASGGTVGIAQINQSGCATAFGVLQHGIQVVRMIFAERNFVHRCSSFPGIGGRQVAGGNGQDQFFSWGSEMPRPPCAALHWSHTPERCAQVSPLEHHPCARSCGERREHPAGVSYPGSGWLRLNRGDGLFRSAVSIFISVQANGAAFFHGHCCVRRQFSVGR